MTAGQLDPDEAGRAADMRVAGANYRAIAAALPRLGSAADVRRVVEQVMQERARQATPVRLRETDPGPLLRARLLGLER